MVFTSYDYLLFLLLAFVLYWALGRKTPQNLLLLVGSYVFYGYVHPWFCILIATSTLVDYAAGLGIVHQPRRRNQWLAISLAANLGMLGVFKYFNFFAENIHGILTGLGMDVSPIALRVFLPVGISFYTFQTLSYTIDIYRGEMEPRRNFLDFALFVAFFPQLVAGPVERAKRFLPQIESPRRWNWQAFASAWPLLVRGYLKKLVIADNVAVYADKVFSLESPSLALLAAGTLAFAVQIYADFSAYTDIARGSARLLGFELIENFRSPYLAISPSDFWRRWHISFSSWIRDYLYISLGGSRVRYLWQFALVLVVSMGLSGLWHGAAWNFIIWGVYHGAIVFAYHAIGKGGRWKPVTLAGGCWAWAVMFMLTLVGWVLFRTPDMGWLLHALLEPVSGLRGDDLVVSVTIACLVLMYASPLLVLLAIDRTAPRARFLHAVFYGLALAAVLTLSRDTHQDFIYFQF